ncbi:hypothetical protein [Klebsiella michiganensis]|uniref:hypothetical protein n=1 Tax=Klebsiella michiganensis TaxID=1134687 RepID=UPI0025A1643F|nr:hypothetical protein [Klebsiella michiganensis]MDM6777234.1 hypothetical protein [Klebsiella michiganensis]
MRLIFSKAPKFDNRFQRALFFAGMAFRQLLGKAPEKSATSVCTRPAGNGKFTGVYVCMFEYQHGGWLSVCCSESEKASADGKCSIRRMKALLDVVAPPGRDDRRS